MNDYADSTTYASNQMRHVFPRIIGEMVSKPWAVTLEKLQDIVELISFRSGGAYYTPAEIQERVGENIEAATAKDVMAASVNANGYESGVAMIPVYGTMVQGHSGILQSSGLTYTNAVTDFVNKAAAQENVKAIVLDIDSPGGSIFGVQELAEAVQAAAKVKPVYAIANSMMASAAYWIGTQATETIAVPGALVGSVGVYSMHVDQSEALAKDGIRVSYVSAGKYKVDGSSTEPLSETAREAMQERVDEYYDSFVGAVAKGMSASVAKVRKGFGEGRALTASKALAEGMVNRIATLTEVLVELGVAEGPKRRKRARAGYGRALNQERLDLENQAIGGQSPVRCMPEGIEDPEENTDPKETNDE